MTEFLMWSHLFGIVISLGGGLFFVLVFCPSLKAIADPVVRRKVFAESLKYFHPLFLFGICLTFMTGAIRLTDLKIGFGDLYYSTFGKILLLKFGLTLLIFLIAGGQCFGMGLKLQRMATGVLPADPERQDRLGRVIRKMTIYNVVLLAVTLYIGMKLVPMVYGSAPLH